MGGNRTVSLGASSTTTLTWGGTSPSTSLPDQMWLYLGSPAADSTIIFQNPINLLNLGNGPQNVWVTAGSGTAAVDAQMSGALSGTGGLTIEGDGNLELSASNTYTGATTLSTDGQGDYPTLRLSNTAALPAASNLTLDGGYVELAAGNFAAPWAWVRARCSSRQTVGALGPWGGTAPSALAPAVRQP